MRIEVKVIPSSSKNRVEPKENGTFKVYVTSSAQKGKANKQVLELLSAFLGKKKYDLRIVRGQTSRHKVIEVND